MSHMNGLAVLAALRIGSLNALWSRIDAGTFPRPVAMSARGDHQWDAEDIRRFVAIYPPVAPQKREQPQPPSRTRERKDPPRTETRKSE